MIVHQRQIVESAMRFFVALVMLANALTPSITATALLNKRSSSTDVGKQVSPNIVQPIPTAAKYQPPQKINRPSRFDAAPDQPASPIPPKSPIEFTLSADLSILAANRQITLKVFIRNNSTPEVDNLIFTDPLEPGLTYIPNNPSSLPFDSSKQQISLAIPKLLSGQQLTFSYVLQVAASKNNDVHGKLWLHVVQLDFAQENIHLKAHTPFGNGLSVGNNNSAIAAFNPDGGWNQLGRFSIYMDQNTIDPNSTLMASPTTVSIKGPALQFKLDVVKSNNPISKDSQGKLAPQTISLGQISNFSFKHPAFMEINLDGYADLKHIPAGQAVYVATYDETNQVWVKVPILAMDVNANKVTVQADHFSTWGTGLGNSLPQDGANVLLFDSHYTNLFTGAARYSIPIWTPPGRNGMTPSISLSYSSATVDGLLGNVQAPWVGEGWNIDSIEIVRKITTSETGYGYIDNNAGPNGVSGYTLAINGQTYNLLVDPNHPNRYYTQQEQGDYLYIERHNDALGNAKDGLGNSPNNTAGEWWGVVTKDGTRYRLGWNNDSEQLALMYGYACTTGNPCNTPNGAYASLGYAGHATNLVAMRWRVDHVTDSHGNFMSYSYTEEHPSSPLVPEFDRASYLQSITYTGHVDGDQPGYQLNFITANRIGDATPQAYNLWDNYDTQQLNEIDVCYSACSSGTVVRKYQMSYTVVNVSDPNGTLTLSSITTSGGGFTDPATSISIPNTQSPTINFSYANSNNNAVSASANPYPYPRLTQISNGYGGTLTYTYETDGRTTDWLDYRVKTVNVSNGIGTAAARNYLYSTPVYDSTNALIGYTNATEVTNDFNGATALAYTVHQFGTAGLDIGNELATNWEDANTAVLKQADNVYVTDNTNAPFMGWNFRYLYQTTNYVKSGGSLIQTSQTQTIRDPSTGNLAEQDDYNVSTLLRKVYPEYWPNFNSAVYILDKPIRQVIVDSGNNIFSDTRYGYDGIANLRSIANSAITKGDVTLVQKLVNGSQTADVSYGYDKYGNRTSACAYASYGTPGNAPSGACESSTMNYDSTLNTFLVQSTDALNDSTTMGYLLTLGLPCQVIDPNNWTTNRTYDGLGRTLSVTPPGLSQAGVNYAYPVSTNGAVGAPYSINMQIWDAPTGTYRNVWGIYDGLGRMIQTQTRDDNAGKLLVSDTVYNAQQLVSQQSSPYYYNSATGGIQVSGASQYTTTTYDALGRATQVTAPGKITTSTSYNGLTTTVTDPNGNQTAHTSDGLGRLTTVQEYSGKSVYATTSYAYDVADHLLTTTDAKSNVTTLQYDWSGRKTSMKDPDMGTWTYQYDPLGNLTQQTDGRGHNLTFAYDNINRLKIKHDATNNMDQATYGYGTTAGSIGMRTSMTDQSGSTSWSYSNYGRTVQETRTIGTVANKISTTASDWLGRVLTVQYPDQETVSYTYDALGRAKNASGSQAGNLATLAYNALSQLTTSSLGNGVTVANSYNSATNRLSERSAAMNSTKLIDFSYLYDQTGNITNIADSVLGETQTFQYDPLNRLINASDVSGTTNKYGQAFQYDKIGDIQQVKNLQSGETVWKDDFEESTLTPPWDAAVQGGTKSSDLWTVSAPAFTPVLGNQSLLVEVNDATDTYVQHNLSGGQSEVRVRFYFHPNNILMANGNSLTLFTYNNSSGAAVAKIALQYSNGVYQVQASAMDNSSNWQNGNWFTIGNQWNALEMDLESAANSGSLGFWVNGAFKQTIIGINNGNQQVSQERLGAMSVNITNVGQSYDQILYDAFEIAHIDLYRLTSHSADHGCWQQFESFGRLSSRGWLESNQRQRPAGRLDSYPHLYHCSQPNCCKYSYSHSHIHFHSHCFADKFTRRIAYPYNQSEQHTDAFPDPHKYTVSNTLHEYPDLYAGCLLEF